MALTTPATLVSEPNKAPVMSNVFTAVLTFPGDDDYATGGTAEFTAFVRAALERDITVLAVFDIGLNGGFVSRFDQANDKLIVLQGDNDNGADGPLVEVAAAADLSSTTFRVAVLGF